MERRFHAGPFSAALCVAFWSHRGTEPCFFHPGVINSIAFPYLRIFFLIVSLFRSWYLVNWKERCVHADPQKKPTEHGS